MKCNVCYLIGYDNMFIFIYKIFIYILFFFCERNYVINLYIYMYRYINVYIIYK